MAEEKKMKLKDAGVMMKMREEGAITCSCKSEETAKRKALK